MIDFHSTKIIAGIWDAALAQHLDEIIAELRDRGIMPRPLNVLHYAFELGVPEKAATDLAALLERRIQSGAMS